MGEVCRMFLFSSYWRMAEVMEDTGICVALTLGFAHCPLPRSPPHLSPVFLQTPLARKISMVLADRVRHVAHSVFVFNA